ncbi:MAG: thiamine pyrophosphate-binding protein [Victivallaceae bacterium]|nr:thiamine pyrophosphate-binding protein [Victivallaceae bacterium]
MRVADYIFKYLADHGIRHAFLVTGGGAMHLNDALRLEKRITPVCHHHEQAAAIAAEGYVRAGAELGVVSVTSGPGGTNSLTGVIAQWLDSIPVLYLSGQVKFETTIASCPELGLRQLGDQEINIVDIVRPVTKYAASVTDPLTIREQLEKALYLARHGRPGPVWLDIPLNVQAAQIDEQRLSPFVPDTPVAPAPAPAAVQQAAAMLATAERPVIIAGFGIRLAKAVADFHTLIEQLQIPVLTTFNGFDLLPSSHPLFFGRIGTIGNRAGNFIVQNADVILSLGSRNNIRQISYNWENFGRRAQKIVVDIDSAELKKPTLQPDLPIIADAGEFIAALKAAWPAGIPRKNNWLTWCEARKTRFPVITDEQRSQPKLVNPYYFMALVSQLTPAACTTVAGNGTACVTLFQSGQIKTGQRIFWNSGCASMGYGLPAAIGAAFGTGRKTVCITGDGSIQMNLQELQTIVRHRLPVKIFILDNHGYSSIRQTQNAFFGPEHIGCEAESGVSFPDMIKIGQAYGLRTEEIFSHRELEQKITDVLAENDPVVCVVHLAEDYIFSPKLSSRKLPDGRMVSATLEDMYPFLERDEFERNMIHD